MPSSPLNASASTTPSTESIPPFVSRGGVKLAAGLDAFKINPNGLVCADLGSNTGGFTDCLLQHGAKRVYSVDTSYGTLAWKLRTDPRVTVLERTNAVHFDPRTDSRLATSATPASQRTTTQVFEGCGLVCIDLGWTRQAHAIPAALRWLRRSGNQSLQHPARNVITLVKPHYEAGPEVLRRATRGVLEPADAQLVLHFVLDRMPSLGVKVMSHIVSPIRGGASRGKIGNIEYLVHLQPNP